MPPAPPKMNGSLNGSVPVELPNVPNTDLNSMTMEELTAYYSEQQLKLTKAEMIAKITGTKVYCWRYKVGHWRPNW